MTLREVARVIRAIPTSDGAGVRLSRSLGTPQLPELDPFLMLDEIGSDDPGDYRMGFPDHPHRGFETVTYMLAGRMEHRDSLGNRGLLGPGDVQWMTTGRGIVHSEMPQQDQGRLWGFQLWVNTPAAHKMDPPHWQDIPSATIPDLEVDGAHVRVLAGRVGEVSGPVSGVATEPVLLDVRPGPGAPVVLPVPASHNAFAYVFEGSVQLGEKGTKVPRGHLAVLGPGEGVSATGEGRLLLVAGRPLGEPVARYGPFVMNTREQLLQAFEDFQAGRLGR